MNDPIQPAAAAGFSTSHRVRPPLGCNCWLAMITASDLELTDEVDDDLRFTTVRCRLWLSADRTVSTHEQAMGNLDVVGEAKSDLTRRMLYYIYGDVQAKVQQVRDIAMRAAGPTEAEGVHSAFNELIAMLSDG